MQSTSCIIGMAERQNKNKPDPRGTKSKRERDRTRSNRTRTGPPSDSDDRDETIPRRPSSGGPTRQTPAESRTRAGPRPGPVRCRRRDGAQDAMFRSIERPRTPHAARPAERPERPQPERPLRGHGHDPPVGDQAPRCARGGQPGHGRCCKGRERLHFLNAAPDQRHRRPLDPLLRPGTGQGPIGTQDGTGGPPWSRGHAAAFVYNTYIEATPERVWLGLTDPDFTTRYWRASRLRRA